MSTTFTWPYTAQINNGWLNATYAIDNTSNTFATIESNGPVGIEYNYPMTTTASSFANAALPRPITIQLALQGYTANAVSFQPVLIPIFDGVEGLQYNINWITNSETTVYINVTDDPFGPGAGNWTWTDISALMVEVLVDKISSSLDSILYLDQIFLQVTYEDFDYVISYYELAFLSGVAITSYTTNGFKYIASGTASASDIALTQQYSINAKVQGKAIFSGQANYQLLVGFQAVIDYFPSAVVAIFSGSAITSMSPITSYIYMCSGIRSLSGGANIIHGNTFVYYPIGVAYFSDSAKTFYPPPPTLLGIAITNGPKMIVYISPLITTMSLEAIAKTSSQAVFTIYKSENQNL